MISSTLFTLDSAQIRTGKPRFVNASAVLTPSATSRAPRAVSSGSARAADGLASTITSALEFANAHSWLRYTTTSRTAIEALSTLNAFDSAPAQIAVVGQASARALREIAGLEPTVVSHVETAAELARQLLEVRATGPFGWPRGERALMSLKRTLEAAGETVRDVVVYRSHECAFADSSADVIVLASPSAARALPLETGRGARLVALGVSTAEALTKRGLPVRICAEPGVNSVLEIIEGLIRSQPTRDFHSEHQPASSQGDSRP